MKNIKICKIGSKVTASYSGGLQMGGFWLVVELAQGGSATNGATLSTFLSLLPPLKPKLAP